MPFSMYTFASSTVHGTLTTLRYITRYWREISLISRRPSARTLFLSAVACYGFAELTYYRRFVVRYHRFNGMRIRNHTREQNSRVMEQWILRTPKIFERLARYTATSHITDKNSLLDAMCVDESTTTPATQLCAGNSALFRQYKPMLLQWIRQALYCAGTIAMRHTGYTKRIHATEIGDYTVWTRVVPNTKPLVMFPGFGLGAVLYCNVMLHFGRTVHIIELPNLGFSMSQDAPGYMTSDTIYRVVRAHVGDEPHDIIAHSLGTSPAAHYINHQHTHHTTPPGQKAVICDGFVCPVDGPMNHIYPFVDHSMYRELICHRKKPFPWNEFTFFLVFVVRDLDVTVFTKRFHNFYDGTLWRNDYKTDIRYIFCERDLLFDVPFIKDSVSKSPTERGKYIFIPKARHGAGFFGMRRNETLKHIKKWIDTLNVTSTTVPYRPVISLNGNSKKM